MGELMWPFKKNEPKPDLAMEAIEDLKSFRDVGETFNYRGIEMIVESYGEFLPYIGFVPSLFAAYKNDHGELKHAKFLPRELPALRAENPQQQRFAGQRPHAMEG